MCGTNLWQQDSQSSYLAASSCLALGTEWQLSRGAAISCGGTTTPSRISSIIHKETQGDFTVGAMSIWLWCQGAVAVVRWPPWAGGWAASCTVELTAGVQQKAAHPTWFICTFCGGKIPGRETAKSTWVDISVSQWKQWACVQWSLTSISTTKNLSIYEHMLEIHMKNILQRKWSLYIRTVWQRTQKEHDSPQKLCNFLILERLKLLKEFWMQCSVQLQWTIWFIPQKCSLFLALTFGWSKGRSGTRSLPSENWIVVFLKVKSTCNMCTIHLSATIS